MKKLSWKDITVDQYISIMRILKDDTLGDKDKMYEICQICYSEDIRQLPINDALECAENTFPSEAPPSAYYFCQDTENRSSHQS